MYIVYFSIFSFKFILINFPRRSKQFLGLLCLFFALPFILIFPQFSVVGTNPYILQFSLPFLITAYVYCSTFIPFTIFNGRNELLMFSQNNTSQCISVSISMTRLSKEGTTYLAHISALWLQVTFAPLLSYSPILCLRFALVNSSDDAKMCNGGAKSS